MRIHKDLDVWTVREAAAQAIGRMIVFPSPLRNGATSGSVGEWIGTALDANKALPRFDTSEFLHANAETLRTLAAKAGEKTSGTAKSLKALLAGKAPEWHPPGAEFGASGPTSGSPTDDDDEERGDEQDQHQAEAAEGGVDPNAPISFED